MELVSNNKINSKILRLLDFTDEESLKEIAYLVGYKNRINGITEIGLFKEKQKIEYNEFVEQYISGWEDAKQDINHNKNDLAVPF